MRRLLELIVLIAAVVCTSEFPQQAPHERKSEPGSQLLTSQDYPSIQTKYFETDKWKKLLVKGKINEVIESIQKILGTNTPVQARTQWENEFTSAEEVRNTVKWSAWKSNKTNLNLIVDTKVAQRNNKIEFLGPGFGLSYQIKY